MPCATWRAVNHHRRLKCLVAIDLKIGEFEPEFVGKMQFYLAALDEVPPH